MDPVLVQIDDSDFADDDSINQDIDDLFIEPLNDVTNDTVRQPSSDPRGILDEFDEDDLIEDNRSW